MTTTTTVHQVVRQSSERTPQTNQHAFQSNNHGKPELIELD